jgi:hypothetical protein
MCKEIYSLKSSPQLVHEIGKIDHNLKIYFRNMTSMNLEHPFKLQKIAIINYENKIFTDRRPN